MGWPEAFEHARRRGGILAVRDAPRFGLSADQVTARARREQWERPFRGQVALPGAPNSHRRRLWAALTAVGGDVAVAGESALWLHGLREKAPAKVELIVDHRRRGGDLGAGVRVRRSRTLHDEHLAVVDGLPTTTVARTIADVAHARGRPSTRGLVIDARQQRNLDIGELALLTRALAGSTGMPLVRSLCWELDHNRCDSVLAAWLWDELAANGLTPDAAEHPVQASKDVTVHLDLAYLVEQVAGEADGFGSHSRRKDLTVDTRRRNTIATLPWKVIWVTWDLLENHRDEVVGQFREELAHARARLRAGLPAQIGRNFLG